MKQKFVLILLTYFKHLAKIQLLKNNPTIIGVTGSAGKTSTRNAIHAILKSKRKVKVSYNANSESGIPLNILGLTPINFSPLDWLRLCILAPLKLLTNWEKYDTYLVEMGIDSPLPPKNMSYLLTIVQPVIGVILNAAPMHSEPFDFLVSTNDPQKRRAEITRLIAQEKGKIVTTLPKQATAVITVDQKEIAELQQQTQAQVISFGTIPSATVQAQTYSVALEGTKFSFRYHNKTGSVFFPNQLLPQHYQTTFAAAVSVGIALNIDFAECCSLLEKNYHLPAGRASVIKGSNGSTILDSSYNSSTKPTLDMLELLEAIPSKRKIALLGDMRELGIVAQLEHEKVANKASTICDLVVLVGPQMRQFALPVLTDLHKQVKWFANAYLAAEYLKTVITKGDLLLVKGSQNTLLLEIAVEQLMEEPQLATKLLARRGEFWDRKRAELL